MNHQVILNISVAYTPSQVVVVHNYTSRGNPDVFTNELNSAINLAKNNDFYIHCAEHGVNGSNIHHECRYTRGDLNIHQVLEHYKRYKNNSSEDESSSKNNLNNCVIFVIVAPEYNVVSLSDKSSVVTLHSNYLKTLENDRINLQIADKYELSDKKNVFTELIKKEVNASQFLNNATYLDSNNSNNSDENKDTQKIIDDIMEENKGLKISRINPFKWGVKNRMALKKHEPSRRPKIFDYANFSHGRYGGQTRRSNRKGKKSFRRHAPLSY